MQMIRHVLGQHDGEVIGCLLCGTVQHLVDGQIHQCGVGNGPCAVTLDAGKLAIELPAALPPNSQVGLEDDSNI
jgi:hypothetical protein